MTILFIVSGILALLLLVGLFMKRKHYVTRAIVIDAPRQKIFDYLKLLKNQDEFNKHAMAAPDRVREFKGTDGTAGYVYAWKGDKNAGEGEKEIKSLIEGKRIETEIRFTKPIRTSAAIVMEMESLSDRQTKVTWSNAGSLSYPLNMFIPMMEKQVGKDMDTSLLTLKNILEQPGDQTGERPRTG